MIDMAKKLYIPAVIEYTKTLADTVKVVKEVGEVATVQAQVLKDVTAQLGKASKALSELEAATAKAASIKNAKDQAYAFKDEVKVSMDELRKAVDTLETLVDKKVWPVPSYADLIFEV